MRVKLICLDTERKLFTTTSLRAAVQLRKFIQKRIPAMRIALVAATLASPAAADPVDSIARAVLTLLSTPDRVQRAVVSDMCDEDFDPFQRPVAGRLKLKKIDRRKYDVVMVHLGFAYAATNSTDGELAAVDQTFCKLAAETR